MMEKLYDALRAAQVPDDKARAAAVEAAQIHELKADIQLLKWMVGFNLAMTVAIIGKLFLT
jgi:hypothetical protein